MRGDPFHNFETEYLRGTVRSLPVQSFTEYYLRKNNITAFFDLFIKTEGIEFAIEIETTLRHLLDNAQKAYAVNVPVWFVVPTRKLRVRALRKLSSLNLMPGGQPVKVMLLGQAEKEIRSYLSPYMTANTVDEKIMNNSKTNMAVLSTGL